MRSKKILTFLFTMISSLSVACVLSTLAWFKDGTGIGNVENIGGSFLQSYFHCGDGTAEYVYDNEGNVTAGPFTITTPRHYENYVKLHYAMEADKFANKGYYFEFGFPINGSSSPVFYETNEYGAVNVEATSTILNLGGMELPPLGDSQKPFTGHVQGNGLTISNFKINGSGYADIGIFGFVNTEISTKNVTDAEGNTTEQPVYSVENCYFDNFTIDTENGDAETNANRHSTIGIPHHTVTNGDKGNIFMGYLAGHTVYSDIYNNVYVNNCTMLNNGLTQNGIDNYGYFGKVEVDVLGGDLGKGHSYTFTLNAEACYSYFKNNYDSLYRQRLLTRQDDETPYANTQIDPGTDTRVETAIGTKTITGDLLKRYTLNGVDNNNFYSLSTTGYQIMENYEDVEHNYNVYYSGKNEYSAPQSGDKIEHIVTNNNASNKLKPSEEPIYATESLLTSTSVSGLQQDYDEQGNPKVDAQGNPVYKPTHYYYKKNDQDTGVETWRYGISYNRAITKEQAPASEYTINFDDFVIDTGTFGTNYRTTKGTKPNLTTSEMKIYLDDLRWRKNGDSWEIVSSTDPNYASASGYMTTSLTYKSFDQYDEETVGGWFSKEYNTHKLLKYSIAPIKIKNLDYGTHNIAASLSINFSGQYNYILTGLTIRQGTRTIEGMYSYGKSATFDRNNSSTTITQTNIEINSLDRNVSSIHIGYSTNTFFSQINDYENTTTTISNPVTFNKANSDGYIVIVKESKEYDLSFYEVVNGRESSSSTTAQSIIDSYLSETGRDIDNSNFAYTISGNTSTWKLTIIEKRIVPSDDDERYYFSESDELLESGYAYENIDVVGGGIGEESGTQFYSASILGQPINVISLQSEKSAGELVGMPGNVGERFYATAKCRNSIVLYLLNTSNAIDGRNDTLGNISFTYAEISLGNFYRRNVVDPSFKKGNDFLPLKSSGDLINDTANSSSGIKLTRTIEISLKEDAVQKVSYCALDEEGKILGRYDSNGNWTGGDQAKIYTYVLVIGGQSSSGDDTWVTNVDFSYTAKKGFGGTFGSVGYRSSNSDIPTLTSTILNFYFYNPDDNKFSVKVSYANTVYTITFTSTGKITVEIYNYDPSTYSVKFNNEAASNAGSMTFEIGT